MQLGVMNVQLTLHCRGSSPPCGDYPKKACMQCSGWSIIQGRREVAQNRTRTRSSMMKHPLRQDLDWIRLIYMSGITTLLR